MIIETDIEKMKSDGKELKQLSFEYDKIIQNFKSSIKSFDGWHGEDADSYKSGVMVNIKIFEDIGSVLDQYSEFLINESNHIEQFVKDSSNHEKDS